MVWWKIGHFVRFKMRKKCRKSHSPVENRFCWVTVTFNLQWPSDLTPKYEICVREKKFFDEKGSSKNVEKVFCRLMNFDWLLRFRRQTHPKREKGDLGTYHALREKLWHVSKIRFILRGDRQRTKNLKKLLNHITQLRRSHLTLLEQKRAKNRKTWVLLLNFDDKLRKMKWKRFSTFRYIFAISSINLGHFSTYWCHSARDNIFEISKSQ